jgi:uncharacterized integral membrane protein
MQLFLILALVIAIVAVIFAVQNVTLVTITFFAWNIHTSLAVALLVALGVGVIITLLLSLPGMFKSGWNSVSQKKKFTSLEADRDKFKKKVDEAVADRDKYLKKLEDSEKEVSDLEEQLASMSAALNEKPDNAVVEVPAIEPAPVTSPETVEPPVEEKPVE